MHSPQFNFYDHSKLILSSHRLLVTHIDNYKITWWTLSEVKAQALNPDPEQAKFNQNLVDKLKYSTEVLASIQNASANQGSDDGNTNTNLGVEGMAPGVSSKTSKQLLR
jgi:cell cycle serine/threonine-protein kinase CDC5/MSD2